MAIFIFVNQLTVRDDIVLQGFVFPRLQAVYEEMKVKRSIDFAKVTWLLVSNGG